MPQRYMEAVREICDKYEVPLIFHAIQTYIRIGKMTPAEHYGETPEFITLGRAVGGGLPLAATTLC